MRENNGRRGENEGLVRDDKGEEEKKMGKFYVTHFNESIYIKRGKCRESFFFKFFNKRKF